MREGTDNIEKIRKNQMRFFKNLKYKVTPIPYRLSSLFSEVFPQKWYPVSAKHKDSKNE